MPNEHRWDFMEDSEKEKEYFVEREKIGKPKRGIVASNPEVTGQVGSMISVEDLSLIDFETNMVK